MCRFQNEKCDSFIYEKVFISKTKIRYFQKTEMCHFQYEKCVFFSNTRMCHFQIRKCIFFKSENVSLSKTKNASFSKYENVRFSNTKKVPLSNTKNKSVSNTKTSRFQIRKMCLYVFSNTNVTFFWNKRHAISFFKHLFL